MAGDHIVLLMKSAFAAAPLREAADLAAALSARTGRPVSHAFTEQGGPSLREALEALRGRAASVTILPLMIPMEPATRNWLMRSLARWQAGGGDWPVLHVAPPPSAGVIEALCAALAAPAPPVAAAADPRPEASLVPAQHYRVLVCQGGPCNAAGSELIWCHLRNLQQRLGLRNASPGTMTARTTCLGPCALAPVMQVWPDGTWYGGVTETALERIVAEHLLGGRPVADFTYTPTGRKQRLHADGTP